MTKIINSNAKEKNIKLIISTYQEIKDIAIFFKESKILLRPFNYHKDPLWWTEYNELKHNRFEFAEKIINKSTKTYFEFANLLFTLLSLSALNILVMFIYRILAINENERIVPNIETKFIIKNSYWEKIDYGDGIIVNIGNTAFIGEDN